MRRTIESMQFGDALDADPEGTEVTTVIRLAVTGTNIGLLSLTAEFYEEFASLSPAQV